MNKPVSELEGVELDAWVAKAEGLIANIEGNKVFINIFDNDTVAIKKSLQIRGDFLRVNYPFSPSSNWEYAGPIIERELMLIEQYKNKCIVTCNDYTQAGQTPLEAAMKAYVASKYGEYVDGK